MTTALLDNDRMQQKKDGDGWEKQTIKTKLELIDFDP